MGPPAGLQWPAVSVEVGLRMLRSAPAIGTAAAAEAAGVAIGDLVVGVERLRGRGRCDRLAAAAMTYPRIARFKKRRILGHRVCPPPVTLRSGWDTGIAAGDRVPGVARWTRRSVELASAPRVAFTAAVAAPVSAAVQIVEQAHCPPAMAVGLAAGPPQRTERLAAVTPHPAALAALVASGDAGTRSVAAGRDDLPAALAAAVGALEPS